MTFQEDSDRRRSAAHVDQRRSELFLILGQHGIATCCGGKYGPGHVEMAPLDGQFEILKRRWFNGNRVHRHADALAEHSDRISDAACLVHYVASRRALNYIVVIQPATLAR